MRERIAQCHETVFRWRTLGPYDRDANRGVGFGRSSLGADDDRRRRLRVIHVERETIRGQKISQRMRVAWIVDPASGMRSAASWKFVAGPACKMLIADLKAGGVLSMKRAWTGLLSG
ncbi:MAG TPA: hypothetical protein VMU50_20730 [Polyangia bacterium]|nr:hypothetical protein [Polyangia bacterium]